MTPPPPPSPTPGAFRPPFPDWPWYVGSMPLTPDHGSSTGIWMAHLGDPLIVAVASTQPHVGASFTFSLRFHAWPLSSRDHERTPAIMAELHRLYTGTVDTSETILRGDSHPIGFVFAADFRPPPLLFLDPVERSPQHVLPVILQVLPGSVAPVCHPVIQDGDGEWHFPGDPDSALERTLRTALPEPFED